MENLLKAIKQIKAAFGAPGDYGYGTKEGDALYNLYKAASDVEWPSSSPKGR